MEKTTKDGTFLVCPNSKAPSKAKTAAKSAKKKTSAKKSAAVAKAPEVEPGSCSFSKKIAEPQPESEPASTVA
jgi:hypothetical protein